MTDEKAKAAEKEETTEESIAKPENVPYIVFQGELARMERMIKRLWIIIIVLITTIIIGIIAAVWYESQFDTISYNQDGAGLNNINTGTQGDVFGTDSENQKEAERQS